MPRSGILGPLGRDQFKFEGGRFPPLGMEDRRVADRLIFERGDVDANPRFEPKLQPAQNGRQRTVDREFWNQMVDSAARGSETAKRWLSENRSVRIVSGGQKVDELDDQWLGSADKFHRGALGRGSTRYQHDQSRGFGKIPEGPQRHPRAGQRATQDGVEGAISHDGRFVPFPQSRPGYAEGVNQSPLPRAIRKQGEDDRTRLSRRDITSRVEDRAHVSGKMRELERLIRSLSHHVKRGRLTPDEAFGQVLQRAQSIADLHPDFIDTGRVRNLLNTASRGFGSRVIVGPQDNPGAQQGQAGAAPGAAPRAVVPAGGEEPFREPVQQRPRPPIFADPIPQPDDGRAPDFFVPGGNEEPLPNPRFEAPPGGRLPMPPGFRMPRDGFLRPREALKPPLPDEKPPLLPPADALPPKPPQQNPIAGMLGGGANPVDAVLAAALLNRFRDRPQLFALDGPGANVPFGGMRDLANVQGPAIDAFDRFLHNQSVRNAGPLAGGHVDFANRMQGAMGQMWEVNNANADRVNRARVAAIQAQPGRDAALASLLASLAPVAQQAIKANMLNPLLAALLGGPAGGAGGMFNRKLPQGVNLNHPHIVPTTFGFKPNIGL